MSTELANAEAKNELIDGCDVGEYAVVLPINELALTQLGKSVEITRAKISDAEDEITRTMWQAGLISMLDQHLDGPLLEMIMTLQNSRNGFKTDKPGDGYAKRVVKEVAITALTNGFRLTGNEVNIISGQLYATKEGFDRLIGEVPGLTRFRYHVAVSEREITGKTSKGTEYGQAKFTAWAEWRLNGVEDSIVFNVTEKDKDIIGARS